MGFCLCARHDSQVGFFSDFTWIICIFFTSFSVEIVEVLWAVSIYGFISDFFQHF